MTKLATGPKSNGTSARRSELLDISAQVFAENGVASSTVRDIADRAGILSGSLYHHFTSKNELVAEILDQGLSDSRAKYEAVLASKPPPAVALDRLVTEGVRWVAEHPNVASILNNDRHYIRGTDELQMAEADRRYNQMLWQNVIQDGINDNTFRSEADAEVVVFTIFDGVLGSSRWMAPVGDTEPEVVSRQLSDLFLGGLVAR